MSDEVLESVRQSLAPVHMDRPLSAIEERGRARRRTRRLAGVAGVAGVGLSVALGLAVVLPMAGPAGRPADKVAQPAAAGQVIQRIDLAAFTLTRSRGGVVQVDFKEAVADPKSLQKALADAGIPAAVGVNEVCHGSPVDGTLELFERNMVHPGRNGRGLTINGASLPKSVALSVVLSTNKDGFVESAAYGFFKAGSAVKCTPRKPVPAAK